MFSKISDHSEEFEKGKQKLSWLFGTVAAISFVLVFWLVDAVKLADANAMYPWAKLLIGILPVLLVCLISSWLSSRVKNALWASLIWAVCGGLITWLAAHLSIQGLTWYYHQVNPALDKIVNYPFDSGIQDRVIMAIIAGVVVGAIAGVFYSILLENAFSARVKASTLISLLLWAVFFAGIARVLDSLVERNLRSPLTAVNQVIKYKVQDLSTPFDQESSRNLNVYAMMSIPDLVSLPHQLILQTYDETQTFMRVAINFSGTWVSCNVVSDSSSEPPRQQVVFCRRME